MLPSAISIVRITETARTSKLPFKTDGLAFAGVPDMLESGLFTTTGKNPKIETLEKAVRRFATKPHESPGRVGSEPLG